jgi:hypothetical protein
LFFTFDFDLLDATARWFFRGNNDTILNLPLLPGSIHELEAKHNQLLDFVALGNCLVVYWRGGLHVLPCRVQATCRDGSADHGGPGLGEAFMAWA